MLERQGPTRPAPPVAPPGYQWNFAQPVQVEVQIKPPAKSNLEIEIKTQPSGYLAESSSSFIDMLLRWQHFNSTRMW